MILRILFSNLSFFFEHFVYLNSLLYETKIFGSRNLNHGLAQLILDRIKIKKTFQFSQEFCYLFR